MLTDRSELLGKLRCLATLLQQLNAQTAAAAVMEAVHQLDAPPPPAEQVITDPHHNGSVKWKWENGKLYQRTTVQSKWTECKRVHATPARIHTLANALPAEQASGDANEELQAYREMHLQLDSLLGDRLTVTHNGDYKAAIENTVKSIAALSQRPVVDEETKIYVGFDKNMEKRLFHLRDSAERHCIGNIDVYFKQIAPQQPTTPVFSSGGNGGSSGVKQPTGEEARRWLCGIGLHRWKNILRPPTRMPDGCRAYQIIGSYCRRCGVRK